MYLQVLGRYVYYQQCYANAKKSEVCAPKRLKRGAYGLSGGLQATDRVVCPFCDELATFSVVKLIAKAS